MALPGGDTGAIAFAEKLLALLDYGSFTATYKFAVLLGLIDYAWNAPITTSGSIGSRPLVRLAQKVTELAGPKPPFSYADRCHAAVLRQCTSGQAEIRAISSASKPDGLPVPLHPTRRGVGCGCVRGAGEARGVEAH